MFVKRFVLDFEQLGILDDTDMKKVKKDVQFVTYLSHMMMFDAHVVGLNCESHLEQVDAKRKFL